MLRPLVEVAPTSGRGKSIFRQGRSLWPLGPGVRQMAPLGI